MILTCQIPVQLASKLTSSSSVLGIQWFWTQTLVTLETHTSKHSSTLTEEELLHILDFTKDTYFQKLTGIPITEVFLPEVLGLLCQKMMCRMNTGIFEMISSTVSKKEADH